MNFSEDTLHRYFQAVFLDEQIKGIERDIRIYRAIGDTDTIALLRHEHEKLNYEMYSVLSPQE